MVVKCLTFSHFCHCSMWPVSLFQKAKMWLIVVFSFGAWLYEIFCFVFVFVFLIKLGYFFIMCAVTFLKDTTSLLKHQVSDRQVTKPN